VLGITTLLLRHRQVSSFKERVIRRLLKTIKTLPVEENQRPWNAQQSHSALNPLRLSHDYIMDQQMEETETRSSVTQDWIIAMRSGDREIKDSRWSWPG
jgi:hypothetical protein